MFPEDLMKAVKLVILPRSDLSQIAQQEVRSTLLLSPLARPKVRFCETRAEGHEALACRNVLCQEQHVNSVLFSSGVYAMKGLIS